MRATSFQATTPYFILARIGTGSLVDHCQCAASIALWDFIPPVTGAFAAKPPGRLQRAFNPGSRSRPGYNNTQAHLVEQSTRNPICCRCSLLDTIDSLLSSGFSVQLGGSEAIVPEASFHVGKFLRMQYIRLLRLPSFFRLSPIPTRPFVLGRPGRFHSLKLGTGLSPKINNHADAHRNLQCLRSGVHGNPVLGADRWLGRLQPGGPALGLPVHVWLTRGDDRVRWTGIPS